MIVQEWNEVSSLDEIVPFKHDCQHFQLELTKNLDTDEPEISLDGNMYSELPQCEIEQGKQSTLTILV